METVKRSDVLTLGGIVSGLIFLAGSFLPIMNVMGESYSLISAGKISGGQTDAVIFIPLAALIILFFIIKKYIPAVIFAVIALSLSVMKQVDLGNLTSQYLNMVQSGIGVYVLIIGSLASLVFAVAGLMNKRKNKVTEVVETAVVTENNESL